MYTSSLHDVDVYHFKKKEPAILYALLAMVNLIHKILIAQKIPDSMFSHCEQENLGALLALFFSWVNAKCPVLPSSSLWLFAMAISCKTSLFPQFQKYQYRLLVLPGILYAQRTRSLPLASSMTSTRHLLVLPWILYARRYT